MEYYATMRKKKILLFAPTWKDPQDPITLSEVSQTDKDKYYVISCNVCNLQKEKLRETESRVVVARGCGVEEC